MLSQEKSEREGYSPLARIRALCARQASLPICERRMRTLFLLCKKDVRHESSLSAIKEKDEHKVRPFLLCEETHKRCVDVGKNAKKVRYTVQNNKSK